MGVDKIVVNPEYNFASKANDLALLQLPRPVDFAANPTIRPVCLPANSSQDYNGRTATVSGWGRQSFGGPASPVLKVNFFSYPNLFNVVKLNCKSVYKQVWDRKGVAQLFKFSFVLKLRNFHKPTKSKNKIN